MPRSRRPLLLAAIPLGLWLLSGFFVVRGNETAVVRRFGAIVRHANGEVRLWPSGWHFDWPWPFATVDRVELNKVRSISIGLLEQDAPSQSGFLRDVDPARQAQFLSGDKNILNVQVSVSYRASESSVADFLFATTSAERRLQTLTESVLADAMLLSGVDFAHTLGRTQLRERLITRLQDFAKQQRLGIDITDVTIGNVSPPLRVKAEFIEVLNARAEKETAIHQARAYAEQRLAESRAASQKTHDAADIYRRRTVETARAESESFNRLVQQFRSDEQSGTRTYATSRQLALRRKYLDTLEAVLKKVATKIVLDGQQAVDLTIWKENAGATQGN